MEVLTQNYTQHTALNVLGTLQVAGGDAKAAVGNPDLASWSPKNLMESNCIHASQDGFQLIFEQVYSMYLANNSTSDDNHKHFESKLRANVVRHH